jgi:hypothetical protein
MRCPPPPPSPPVCINVGESALFELFLFLRVNMSQQFLIVDVTRAWYCGCPYYQNHLIILLAKKAILGNRLLVGSIK